MHVDAEGASSHVVSQRARRGRTNGEIQSNWVSLELLRGPGARHVLFMSEQMPDERDILFEAEPPLLISILQSRSVFEDTYSSMLGSLLSSDHAAVKMAFSICMRLAGIS